MKKSYKVKFASDNKIDSFAHKMVEELFDLEWAFLTNESTLEDFLSEDDIPGHKLILFKDIPKGDKDLYEDEKSPFGTDKYWVWYPPLTNTEIKKMRVEERNMLLKKIEKVFGISMANYPKEEALYIWKVAEFVKKKLDQN